MDTETRKAVMRMFNYGLFVLTSKSEEKVTASTVTWVSQASFEPLLISVAIRNSSTTLETVQARGEFLLHLLGRDQKEAAAACFKATVVEENRINGLPFKPDDNDLPELENAAARLSCRVAGSLCRGDHTLILGEVYSIKQLNRAPLLDLHSTGWHYGG
ncbi:MAG: flavin reductase family protein [FCB group bacterium]|nr:flavin reductase family protein [FCB group bacterium]